MISASFANKVLRLFFNGEAITGIAGAPAAPLAGYYWSLHTADPGPNGAQSASEVAYTGYSRLLTAIDNTGFTVTGNTVSPVETMEFAEKADNTNETVTHVCLGTAASGTGEVLFRFALDTPMLLNQNTMPRLRNTTTLTVVTS